MTEKRKAGGPVATARRAKYLVISFTGQCLCKSAWSSFLCTGLSLTVLLELTPQLFLLRLYIPLLAMTTSSDGSPQSLRERGDPLVSARNISRSSSATWQRTLTKKMVDGMSKNIHRARTSLSSMVGFGMAPEAARSVHFLLASCCLQL